MIELVALVGLPLMDHFMKERVEGGLPAVATNVPARNDDLWRGTTAGCPQFTQPTSHPIGKANWNRCEVSREVFRIEHFMQMSQSIDERLIHRSDWPWLAGAFRSRCHMFCHRKLHEGPARCHSLDARHPAREESHDCAQHVVRCSGVAGVESQATARAPADHDRAIARDGNGGAGIEAEAVETISQREIERQR